VVTSTVVVVTSTVVVGAGSVVVGDTGVVTGTVTGSVGVVGLVGGGGFPAAVTSSGTLTLLIADTNSTTRNICRTIRPRMLSRSTA